MEPLRVEDAAEVAAALADPELHLFIGGQPANADELRTRFELLVVGESPDGSQGWLNWVLRDKDSADVVGTVQATLIRRDEGDLAEVAWTVGTRWQGQGRGKDAAGALVTWLWGQGVDVLVAHI
ncbi:MAG: GNAT family N-acetyltransferase, partial [Actinomycetes bacterium]